MSLVQFGSLQFRADLVILDKDGTLIDFESMWGRLVERAVHHLTAGIPNDELERELYATLGYDPQADRLSFLESALPRFRKWSGDPNSHLLA